MGCIIPHKGKDIQGLCPECIGHLATTQSFVWSVIAGFHKRCSGISGKLKSNADYHCRRCLEDENSLFQSVLLKEVVIEPNVKLECVTEFCYLGDTFGVGGGAEEAARVRVRCVGLSSRSYLLF